MFAGKGYPWLARRPGAVVLGGLAVATAVVLWLVYLYLRPSDLTVYRDGGRALLRGLPLYAERFAGPLGSAVDLPFTYPPLAAVLFAPLAALPVAVANAVFTTVSLAALVAVLVLLRRLRTGAATLDWRVLLLAAVALAAVEPVRSTVILGQVNLVLAALVLVDVAFFDVAVPRRWSGVLLGVAAAVKLTPAVFVLLLLVQRRWRAAGLATVTAAACTGLAWLAAPTDSAAYWLRVLRRVDRIGDPGYLTNQSLAGVLIRFGAPAVVWLPCCVAVLAAGVVLAVRWRAEPLTALSAVALGGLLASPISWTHHWVWVLAAAAARPRAAAPLLLVTLLMPPWWVPHDHDAEHGWTLLQAIPGNAYALAALVYMTFLTCARRPPVPSPP